MSTCIARPGELNFSINNTSSYSPHAVAAGVVYKFQYLPIYRFLLSTLVGDTGYTISIGTATGNERCDCDFKITFQAMKRAGSSHLDFRLEPIDDLARAKFLMGKFRFTNICSSGMDICSSRHEHMFIGA